jgi:hypothetical protein
MDVKHKGSDPLFDPLFAVLLPSLDACLADTGPAPFFRWDLIQQFLGDINGPAPAVHWIPVWMHHGTLIGPAA